MSATKTTKTTTRLAANSPAKTIAHLVSGMMHHLWTVVGGIALDGALTITNSGMTQKTPMAWSSSGSGR